MTPASRGQLARMLGAFGSAGVGRFDVGALDHGSGKMSLRLDWDRGMLWRAAGWIAGRNATGSSLYIRPARSLEAHPWVLVDGLTGGTLARLREGHPPGLVVETSPGRFQAWVRVAMALPAPGRGAIARALARRYVGDPHGAGGDGLGRLAGTTNRKPGRRRPDGQAPFARVRHTSNSMVAVSVPNDTNGPPPPRQVEGEGPRLPGRTIPSTRRRSRSERDFAIACRLTERGAGDEAIAAAIHAVRGSDPEGVRADYLDRTIRAARRRIGEERCT